jgi:hypothetical protein
MTMIAVGYTNGKKLLLSGGIDLDTDTIKVALLKSTYTPDVSSDYWSDISVSEISATGDYASGGVTLTGAIATNDDTNEQGVLDYDDVILNGVTIPDFQYLVIYKSTGIAASSPLLFYLDMTAPTAIIGRTIIISWNSLGVVRLS